MGSPPLRLVAFLSLAAVLAGVAAFPARADEQGATKTASAFIDAVGRSDAAAACGPLTPKALERFGGLDRCRKTFGPAPEQSDYRTYSTLYRAFHAAEKSAVRRRGQFVNKSFSVRALARDIEKLDEDLTVKLGKGPKAATDQLTTTVILDRRSNARRVVLYAESDDGSIFRLSAAMLGEPDFEEVAQGLPEKDPGAAEGEIFVFRLSSVTLFGEGHAYVGATLTYTEDDETYVFDVLLELVATGDRYLVDDLFYSLVSLVQAEE